MSGIMMILSPAKTLDLTPYTPPTSSSSSISNLTNPSCNPGKTLEIAKAMKSRDEKSLAKLLSISAKLAQTTHKHWSEFSLQCPYSNQKPAIYAFSGAAYQGLQISTCSSNTIQYLQTNLRIIDPLYGVLRPLDSIQPYRLEMATKNVLPKTNLTDYWKESVSSFIAQELSSRTAPKILVNVASDEYSNAVDSTMFPSKKIIYLKIVFREEGKIIAVHAKRARGLFVRYLAEHNVQDVQGMKKFDLEGYHFVKEESDDKNVLVFDRKKQVKKTQKKRNDVVASGDDGKKTRRRTKR